MVVTHQESNCLQLTLGIDKIQQLRHIKTVLQSGETIHCTSKGTLDKMMAAISSAVLSAGTFVATGVHTRRRSSKKVDFGLLEIYICLTNQRLLIFKTNWIGRPRELWASFDLKDIDTVELKMKKMFWQLPAIKLKLKNDEKIGFWSAKTYKKRTLRLVKKLQELVS